MESGHSAALLRKIELPVYELAQVSAGLGSIPAFLVGIGRYRSLKISLGYSQIGRRNFASQPRASRRF
jgi:hypothetical protein